MFVRRKDAGNHSYFLANGRCFFQRSGNSGFRSKWCGLWSGGKKYIEYYAVKVDGVWLSPENHKSLEYDFSKAVHTYETARGKVTETVFVPEESGCVMVIVDAWPGARIEAKVAVNIRMRNENVTERRYSVTRAPGHLKIENGIGAAFVAAGDGGRFETLGAYEEHCPSGENQNYFLPARLLFSRKRAVFCAGPERGDAQSADALLSIKESAYARHLNGKISCDSDLLSRAFGSCVLSLELLKKDGGYYAGLPWFQQFWGRDMLWSLPGIISTGRHDDARNMLRLLSEKSEGGRIPNFISEAGEKAMNAIDATPLWVIGLERYVRCSGDSAFLKEMENQLCASLDFLSSRSSGGLLAHDASGPETWMDTLARRGAAVEVQSLYHRALRSASYLYGLLSRDAEPLKRRSEWLEKSFCGAFCRGRHYADSVDGGKAAEKKTANVLVPLFMGPGKGLPAVLGWAESPRLLLSGRGIRTLSKDEEEYNPSGYHTGSSWSLTTAWAAAAEFSLGRENEGWSLLKILAEDTERDGLGCIGECWDSDALFLTGCQLQLWGASLFITLVDDFMLGIEVDAAERTVSVAPRIPRSMDRIERSVLVGKEFVTIAFTRSGKDVSVSCSSPAVKLIKKPAQINYVGQ